MHGEEVQIEANWCMCTAGRLDVIMLEGLKWYMYYDQKIISFFSSDFESIFA